MFASKHFNATWLCVGASCCAIQPAAVTQHILRQVSTRSSRRFFWLCGLQAAAPCQALQGAELQATIAIHLCARITPVLRQARGHIGAGTMASATTCCLQEPRARSSSLHGMFSLQLLRYTCSLV